MSNIFRILGFLTISSALFAQSGDSGPKPPPQKPKTVQVPDLGFAFFAHPQGPLVLSARLAVCIGHPERKPEDARVTCRQILESLQVADPDAGLKSVGQLPDYVGGLVEEDCPIGRGVLASIHLPSGTLSYTWERDFHPTKPGWPVKEKCLANPNTGVWVLSLACGNPILSPKGYAPTVAVAVKPLAPAPPVRRDTTRRLPKIDTVFVRALDSLSVVSSMGVDKLNRDKTLFLPNPTVIDFTIVRDTGRKVLFAPLSTASIPAIDTLWVSILVTDSATKVSAAAGSVTLRGNKDSSFVLGRVGVHLGVTRDTARAESGSHWRWFLAGALIGGGAVWFIAYNQGQRHVTCNCKSSSGAPVNPPAQRLPGAFVFAFKFP